MMGFWPFFKQETEDDNSPPYDVVKSVVYRQLDGLFSIVDDDERLDRAETRLDEIEASIPSLTCQKSARAYRYWLPTFRRSLQN